MKKTRINTLLKKITVTLTKQHRARNATAIRKIKVAIFFSETRCSGTFIGNVKRLGEQIIVKVCAMCPSENRRRLCEEAGSNFSIFFGKRVYSNPLRNRIEHSRFE